MRSRTTVVATTTAACALLTVLLAGCGLGQPAAAPHGGDVAAAGESTATAPSAPTPKPTATRSPIASATPTKPPTASPTVAPSWPKALGEPSQGDPVWAVYLAIGHSASDAALERAVAQAATVGYQAVLGDLACDDGATQALGLDEYDYWSGATLYFATEQQARGFAAAYTAKVAAPKGLTKVNVGCLD
jgi:hypothetical protein